MTTRLAVTLWAAGALAASLAVVPLANAESRGELLYSTHCIACHSTQVHWRDDKQATDWAGLEAQVRRWQAANMLRWNDDDIGSVTRYLNDTFYHFAPRPPSG